MKRYEKYKDCGIAWFGKIPEHWGVIKLNFVAYIYGGSTPKSNIDEYWDGDINWVTTDDLGKLNGKLINSTRRKITEKGLESCSATVNPKGSIVLSSRAPIGHLGILNIDACTNQGCKSIVPNENVNKDYLYYFFLSAKEDLQSLGSGSTFTEISTAAVKNYKIIHPSYEEQATIAAFLDHKTAQIDALIEKKVQLIEKLKLQRQAIINEAVTKGLNPNAPMKNSGIEWLGEIPEHWEVTSIKNVLKIPITDGPHTTPELIDDGIPFISAESIKDGKIDFERKRGNISEEDYLEFSKKYIPERNDIYMVKSGATTGNIAMVEADIVFTIWSPLAVFRADEGKVSHRYLFNFLLSNVLRYQVELNWSYGTQQNIGMGVLSNLKIIYPEIKEQHQIVTFIKERTLKIDVSLSKIAESIEKLKRYRQSLISEAVTGKIDVRDWETTKTNEER